MKHRISKKTLSQMPAPIAAKVKELGERFNLKSFSYYQSSALKVYHAEGSKYFYFYDGKELSVEMVSENTVGASGVRYEIGAEVLLPVGAVVIEVWYLGGFGMSISSVGDPLLSMDK